MRSRREEKAKGLASSALASESIELESEGTPLDLVGETSIAGTMIFSGCGGQHNVSLAHILQLMFSNRLPSGIVVAQRENTALY